MNKFLSYFMTISLAFLMASGVAVANEGKGCNLQGAWAGIMDQNVVVVTYVGQSYNSGIINEEIPAFDVTFGGMFPVAKASNLKGMWKRTGGNSFVYTQIAVAVDELGNVLYVAKNSGNKTLSDDCNKMTVESSLEIFVPPDDNPFEDEAWMILPLDPIYAYRMRIDPSPLLDD